MPGTRIMITLTVFPPGQKPIYSIRTGPYTDVATVLATTSDLLYSEPLLPHVPEPL